MTQVNMLEAKNDLSKLVRMLENKEEDINLEDREAEKIANAILELRERNGIR